jgi:hypothetical protein
MGRKKINIDWNVVDTYLQAHCNGAAIARLLGLHPNTLYNAVKEKYKCDFSEYSHQKKEEGVAMVEASIFKDANTKGGVDRMFWLKNKAGWKDRQEFEHSGSIAIPIEGIKIIKDGPDN